MFGFHTPVNTKEKVSASDRAGPSKPTPSVRRSIAEIESGTLTVRNSMTPPKTTTPETTKLGPAVVREPEVETLTSPLLVVTASSKNLDRVAEAKACLVKGKLHINSSRNLKVTIKNGVLEALDRLYQLVKEGDAVKGGRKPQKPKEDTGTKTTEERTLQNEEPKEKRIIEEEWMKQIQENSKLLKENNEKMESLKETLIQQKEILEKTTYAGIVTGQSARQPREQAALHSVVISSKDETETGEEVLTRVRQVMNAKEGGIKVDSVRKAKDRKIIVGCRTEEERQKIKQKLKNAEKHLNVEEVKNKDPLLILKDVLQYNTDEDIVNALRNQNGNIFSSLKKEDNRVEIKFRKKSRNPHASHVVLRVSPALWNRMTGTGEVHIDLQRIKVTDQSPLIQCSLCLGYGHGRRFCKETVEKCSHCGGPHMKSECASWLAGLTPTCCNCLHAKMDNANHNAFSQECPIRRKWDALARASVAYC